ncbi:MarR family winged helix-turn-helix transcriptional regulator [Spongisporangium articulatum]|uniref:MarR family winged helix-turn-helix transcriptional regulator n=1 Tax=Spongisporangium articulatum TaxID=3362603 RepID=A0ABW8AQS2_9ACTN
MADVEPCTGVELTTGAEAQARLAPDTPSCARDLGFALGTLLREYHRQSAAAFEELPGGPRGFLVLLRAGEGGGRNQASLAADLGLDRTVMTYLLDELAGAGLIERRPDPADRRARLIALTTAGEQTVTTIGTQLRAVEDDLLAPLGDDAGALRTLLHRASSAVVAPPLPA